MEKSKIIEDVKVILDENEHVFGTLDVEGNISDPDQLQTDTIIARLIDTAIDAVNQVAPLGMLSDIAVQAKELEWVDFNAYCSRAEMPSDFLRIAYLKLKDWRRGTTEFLDEDDELYAEFFAEQAGVRPTRIWPAAAIVTSDTESHLDVVGCPRSSGEGVKMRYIRKSEENDGDYTIASQCYWATIYMIAKLYYVTLGEKERASMMEEEVAQRLGLKAEKREES